METSALLDLIYESFFFTLKFEKSSRQQLAVWDAIGFISTGYILMAVVVLFLELIVGFAAPYGKFYSNNVLGLCPVPARFAWFVQELPSFAIPCYFLLRTINDPKVSIINRGILFLMVLHYFNRTFIYSMRIKGGKPTAFMACFLAFVFTSLNGYLQSLCLIQLNEYQIYDLEKHIHVYIGVFLFVLGFAINFHSDNVLRNLRKPGETHHKIPRGGVFEYVSNAHYFGENLEWLGFAIAGNNVGGYVFALFTFANLFGRAVHTHQWYLKKFDDYPKSRKIYIPFIL